MMDLQDFINADTFDSRDVIARIDDLASWEIDDADDPDYEMLATESDELDALRAFADEAAGSEWAYGQGFISDSYFIEYAMEYAEDVGLFDSQAGWPMYCIDWEHAANELKMDYSAVELGGVTFWTMVD